MLVGRYRALGGIEPDLAKLTGFLLHCADGDTCLTAGFRSPAESFPLCCMIALRLLSSHATFVLMPGKHPGIIRGGAIQADE